MDEVQPVSLDGVDGDPGRLLTFARDRHRAEVLAQRDVFLAAAAWAEMHSEDSITADDWIAGGEVAKPVAGAGCPLVAEFCVAEFAVVTGRSTESGRRYLGQVIECRYRLPQLFSQVAAGAVPAWKALQIAEATTPLCPEAAGFVDAQVAAVAAKIGLAQLGRLIGEAITRFDPDLAAAEAEKAMDGRHVALRFGQTGGNAFTSRAGTEGTVSLDGILDYADARDLEIALQAGAADLADLGSTEALDVRRSQALGVIARRDLTLEYETTDPSSRPHRPRQVVIYAHLSADAITGHASDCELARVEGHGWITADQVRSWAGPETQLVIKPVIDTTGHLAVDAYEIPDRLVEQITVAHTTCAFPGCTRPARSCDCDHITPASRGGPTCTGNLAPLCRGHHRLKTHTGWTYEALDVGTYLWTSPHGHRILVDPTGTKVLDPEP